MMSTIQRPSTATKAGYHFLSLYQECPWKWYLRYFRKISPIRVSRYLLFGQAFHAMKEAFYLSFIRDNEIPSCDEFVSFGLDFVRSLKLKYLKAEHFEDDLVKMRIMAYDWYNTFGPRDFEEYDILDVEPALDFTLPGKFSMTVRPDCVVREKSSGFIYAFETKTTSRSIPEMARSVDRQGQVDIQSLAILSAYKAAFPNIENIFGGIIPDICYSKGSVHRAERTPPILRSKKRLADSQLAFAGLFGEIGQKVLAVEGSGIPEMYFSRSGSWCAQYECEYESICHARFETTPPGFESNEDLEGENA